MKRWLARLFGKKSTAKETIEQTTGFPVPWESHSQSIYHLLAPHAEGSDPLPESAQKLPDEQPKKEEMSWAAGAMDGVFTHHASSTQNEEIADTLFDALNQVLILPSWENMEKLYTLLKDESPLEYIDALMAKIPQASSLPPQQLHDLAVWLAQESPDRQVVKCAIALLSFFPSQQNLATVMTLGLHDEFTLFSTVAISNIVTKEGYEATLVEMARRVTGWGRIQIIERLPEELSETTRDWLLRDGYSNAVMMEYTALECAIKGQLLTALMSNNVDDALLNSAGEMLSALLNEAPVSGISCYEDGVAVCLRYLTLVKQNPTLDITHLLAAHALGEFVEDDDRDWDRLASCGWNEDSRQHVGNEAHAIVAQPKWQEEVSKALSSHDSELGYAMVHAARVLNIDPWDALYARQSTRPSAEDSHWYALMKTDDRQHIERVVALAEKQFDLAAIATGPDTQMGFGPAYQQHRELSLILQDLDQFAGAGVSLIEAGLRSPVIRNRNMALHALEGWPKKDRPAELHALLETAYQQEPEESVRNRLQALLAE